MKINFAKFPNPVMGNETQKLYVNLYGDAGEKYADVLNTSPDEIAVISRLIACLKERIEDKICAYDPI